MEQLSDLAQALSDNPAFESCDTPDTDCNLSPHKTRRRKSRKTDASGPSRRRVISDWSLSSGEDPMRSGIRAQNRTRPPRCLHSDSDESHTDNTMSRSSVRQPWLSRTSSQTENRMEGRSEHGVRRRRRQCRMSVDCSPNTAIRPNAMEGVSRGVSSSASPRRKRKRSATVYRAQEAMHSQSFVDDEMEYSDPSSYLSSDDNRGFVTNDEGREGDDEQSDFFHEPGSSFGIVSLIESDALRGANLDSDAEEVKSPQLCRLLNECFVSVGHRYRDAHPYKLARVFKHKGREFRQGCRRINNQSRDPVEDSLPAHPLYGGSAACPDGSYAHSDTGGEKKRRKDVDQSMRYHLHESR